MENEAEEYREKIVEMVNRIDNLEWLQFIHRLIKNLVG